MASYRVRIRRSVEKDLRRLPRNVIERILSQIEELSENPRPHQSRKLAGADRLYHVRVGDYRVIYEVDDEASEVIVFYARHRSDAYRGL
jgi:mRNA interferase RelE/StbE